MDQEPALQELARRVADNVLRDAEPIAMQHGGGHRLDVQRLYEEVLEALRAAARG